MQVHWEITPLKSSASLVSEDITPTKGDVIFLDQEKGVRNITVSILPYGGKDSDLCLGIIHLVCTQNFPKN